MAGDLEEFLKRAAERRAQKQRQQQAGDGARQASRPKPRPEYSDARRERQVRQPAEDPIPVAEVVEAVNPLAEQQRKLAESKKRAEEAKRKLAEQKKKLKGKGDSKQESSEAAVFQLGEGKPGEQLLKMIYQPGGIQQAFLLREILDRPADRW
jgi:small-conductance mechanosensitive channel